MSFCLRLELARAEGALERVLATVRRRGFEVGWLVARPCGEADGLDLLLRLAGPRPPENLLHQCRKLVDVRWAELVADPAEGAPLWELATRLERA